MSRLKNFHNRPQKTKGFSAGKGTKGSFGRGLRGFRDLLTAGAIFPEAALANAIKKGLTGEGLEGFEDSPKGMRKGGVVRCVDKSDKPMKIKKTKKVAKRGQRGVGAAKRGFGRAVV